MITSRQSLDQSLFETIDFRAFFEVLRLRWWIVPVAVITSVGLITAREADVGLQSQTFFISKAYQLRDPYVDLAAGGVRIGTWQEFPSPDNQLLLLRGYDTTKQIEIELGKDIAVNLPKDINESPFTMTCNEPIIDDCTRALDTYEIKFQEIRRSAIVAGLSSLRAVLVGRDPDVSNDEITPGATGTTPEISVGEKIRVIDRFLDNVSEYPILIEVDRTEQVIGANIQNVERSTYVLGIAVGFLLSLLILVQLTYSDSRIRSVRQLVRVIPNGVFLGRVATKRNLIGDRRAAIMVYQGLTRSRANHIRFVTLRGRIGDEGILARLANMTGSTHSVTKPFSELTVPELVHATTDEVDVVVVERNRDRRKDVSEVVMALQSTSRALAGVLLIN